MISAQPQSHEGNELTEIDILRYKIAMMRLYKWLLKILRSSKSGESYLSSL